MEEKKFSVNRFAPQVGVADEKGGWHNCWSFCTGIRHFRVEIPKGVYTGQAVKVVEIGRCDFSIASKQSYTCKNSERFEVGLGLAVKLKMVAKVPDGNVLVVQTESFHQFNFFTFNGGSVVETSTTGAKTLLKDGETCEVLKDFGRTCTVTNHGGKAFVFDPVVAQWKKEVEEAEKVNTASRKDFARRQSAFLRECGFTKDQADRIFQAAGPRLVRQAVEYAIELYECCARNSSAGQTPRSILGPILKDMEAFGPETAFGVIQLAHLPLPEGRPEQALRVIQGAMVVIRIGQIPKRLVVFA